MPLASLKKAIEDLDALDEDEKEEPDEGAEADAMAARASTRVQNGSNLLKKRFSVVRHRTEGLVDDVLEVLQQKEMDDAHIASLEENEREREEAERNAIKAGLLSLEGHLDKKSPSSHLWQVSADLCLLFCFISSYFFLSFFSFSHL